MTEPDIDISPDDPDQDDDQAAHETTTEDGTTWTSEPEPGTEDQWANVTHGQDADAHAREDAGVPDDYEVTQEDIDAEVERLTDAVEGDGPVERAQQAMAHVRQSAQEVEQRSRQLTQRRSQLEEKREALEETHDMVTRVQDDEDRTVLRTMAAGVTVDYPPGERGELLERLEDAIGDVNDALDDVDGMEQKLQRTADLTHGVAQRLQEIQQAADTLSGAGFE